MKKVFKYLSAFLMAVIMVFAVSGCSFASSGGGINSNGSGAQIQVECKDVTVKRSETSATREKLSLEDAVELTEKSVVAIEIGGGAGAGVKVDPVAFLVVKDGLTRVMPVAIPAAATVDRVLDLVPEVLDRVQNFVDKKREEKDIY